MLGAWVISMAIQWLQFLETTGARNFKFGLKKRWAACWVKWVLNRPLAQAIASGWSSARLNDLRSLARVSADPVDLRLERLRKEDGLGRDSDIRGVIFNQNVDRAARRNGSEHVNARYPFDERRGIPNRGA